MKKKNSARTGKIKLHIVKRRGHMEAFDERKVYASSYSACMSAHADEKRAEKVAERVTSEVKRWIRKRKSVTSGEIKTEVIRQISKVDKDAAFMYETHLDVA